MKQITTCLESQEQVSGLAIGLIGCYEGDILQCLPVPSNRYKFSIDSPTLLGPRLLFPRSFGVLEMGTFPALNGYMLDLRNLRKPAVCWR